MTGRTRGGNAARCLALAAGLGAATGAAQAQEALYNQGSELYQQNCALCHESNGLGNPPDFPALSANPIVADLNRIVANVHEGRGNMPAFPTLGPEQIAAIATFVRGAWENSYPEAHPDEVGLILERLGGSQEAISIWDGVYTEEQAERAMAAYRGPCGLCHGTRMNGAPDDPDMRPAPALSRARFIRNWEGRSLATLFHYTRATMPQSNPGFMDDQTYVDIIALMLATSGAPAGEEELTPDEAQLARIVIRPEP